MKRYKKILLVNLSANATNCEPCIAIIEVPGTLY